MYISTRGPGQPQSFTDVLLAGMAPDGGLYIPQEFPSVDDNFWRGLCGKSYAEVAFAVVQNFVGDDIAPDILRGLLEASYDAEAFDHEDVAPLTKIDDKLHIMELFHGPTLSFKDYALQFLGRVFDYVLEQRGQRITIVGATSGDTGSAAIEACKGCKNIDIFILYPQGRTSDVQRKQMTTIDAPNVHTIELQGNFDDCQALVKSMFADKALREEINLSAVNSINWARIMAQTVYYVTAAVKLGAPEQKVSFAVPTGNFGNIYAASVARRMGLPIHQLVIGTNQNDIITRFFETGEMSAGNVHPSLSPSMDIQISSNFERYLCGLMGRDHELLRAKMNEFSSNKTMSVNADLLSKAQKDFTAYSCTDEQTLEMITRCYKDYGEIIDPHSAVALFAALQAQKQTPDIPMVSLACAHPAKFPEAVKEATGVTPDVPERLQALLNKEEHINVLPHDLEQVSRFVRDHIKR